MRISDWSSDVCSSDLIEVKSSLWPASRRLYFDVLVVYQSLQCIVGSGGVVLLVDTPTKAQSLGLSAFDALKTDILYAELAPGEQLPLRVLCDRYGCGASPIREALTPPPTPSWVVVHPRP